MAYPFGGWQSSPYSGMPPMGFGQGQYQQQMAQQAAPQSGGQSPFTMVPTIADVDKVMVQPGETRWIMVQNEPVMAVKKADTMGYASGEYYRLTKIDPAAMQTPAETQYLTSAQADQKIQAAVKAEVERVMAQYQTAPAAPARPARAKEG
jgi:hypothetical protein